MLPGTPPLRSIGTVSVPHWIVSSASSTQGLKSIAA
jgi:hypothetical protein